MVNVLLQRATIVLWDWFLDRTKRKYYSAIYHLDRKQKKKKEIETNVYHSEYLHTLYVTQ